MLEQIDYERERKFLLKMKGSEAKEALKAFLRQAKRFEIRQIYVNKTDFRIREKVDFESKEEFYFAGSKIKAENGRKGKKREIEPSITKESFEEFWNNFESTSGKVIKTRFVVEYINYKIELDVFKGDQSIEGFVEVEVEFKTDQGYDEFIQTAHPFLGKEITGVSQLSNKSIANNGLPNRLKIQEYLKKVREYIHGILRDCEIRI